jgi:hypothetical protein
MVSSSNLSTVDQAMCSCHCRLDAGVNAAWGEMQTKRKNVFTVMSARGPPHTNICHKPAAQGNEWRVLLFLAEAFVIVRGIGGVMRVIPPQLSDDVHHNECLVSHVSGAEENCGDFPST